MLNLAARWVARPAGSWDVSPAASWVETQAVRWAARRRAIEEATLEASRAALAPNP